MKVIINPYARSVEIDGIEVKQQVLPYPDYLNHLASISCTYDAGTITDVQSVHRYVSHFVEKEYYLEQVYAFDLDDIKEAVQERISYFEKYR